MVLVTANRGLVEAEVESETVRSQIGEHHSAIGHYLETGDDSRLAKLRGTEIRVGDERYRLETDPGRIEDIAMAGDLGYDDIYVLE